MRPFTRDAEEMDNLSLKVGGQTHFIFPCFRWEWLLHQAYTESHKPKCLKAAFQTKLCWRFVIHVHFNLNYATGNHVPSLWIDLIQSEPQGIFKTFSAHNCPWKFIKRYICIPVSWPFLLHFQYTGLILKCCSCKMLHDHAQPFIPNLCSFACFKISAGRPPCYHKN